MLWEIKIDEKWWEIGRKEHVLFEIMRDCLWQ